MTTADPEAAQAARRSTRSRGTLARFCHDLETPVGVAIVACSLQPDRIAALEARLGPALTPELQGLLADLRDSAQLVAESLDRCVELIASHRPHIRPLVPEEQRTIRLGECLRAAMRVPIARYAGMNVHCSVDCDAGADMLPVADPGAWHQLLGNLIGNAILHGFHGRDAGRITIEARLAGPRLQVRFGDDGPGLPPAVRAAVRLGRSEACGPTGGSGLGLAIVADLVRRRLGGRFTVEEGVGLGGACFLVDLPLPCGAAVPTRRAPAPPGAALAARRPPPERSA